MKQNEQNNENVTDKEEKEKKQKIIIIALIVLVIILLLALLFSFVFNKGKTTEVIKYKSILPSIRSEMQNDSNIKRALGNSYTQITCNDFNDIDRCNDLMNKLGLTDYELFYTKSIKDNIENFKDEDKVYTYLQDHADSDEEVIILYDKSKDTVEYLNYDTSTGQDDSRPPAVITCLETKYNGKEQMIATCEGGIVSDNAKQIEAGDQLITCMADFYHSDSSKKCKMDKYDGKLSMTVTKVTIEYTGEPVTADVESLIDVPIDIQYFSDPSCVAEAEPISVGTYYITASIKATENYDSATLECKEAIEITKKHDVVYINPKAGVYNGSPIPANDARSESGTPVSITYFRGENCSGATLSGPPTELGNYSVSATSQGNEDYLPATVCVKHTIAINNTAYEGSCNDLEFNGNDQTLASGGRHITYFNNSGRAAGQYEVVAQADDMYAFGDGETVKILMCEIKQANQVATTGTCENLVYNGLEQDLVTGGTHVVYVSNKGINAGEYEVVVRAEDGYIFEDGTTSATLTCKINKKHIVVTADTQTKKYDGTALSSSGCVSDGIVQNDSLTCTMTSDSTITNVGTVFNEIKSVVIKTMFGNISNNYDVELVSGKLTILPGEDKIRIVTVTSTYDGTEKAAAFSSASGSTISYTYYTDSTCETSIDGIPKNAGIYYATASTEASVNYPSATLECTKAVTILKKQDVVTIVPKNAVYTGDPVPANKAESDSKTTIMYSYYTSNDCSGTSIVGEPIDVGNYSVKATSDGDENYISGTVCVNHRIVKGTPIITILDKEENYNGEQVETNPATATLPNGNEVALDYNYKYYTNDTCTQGERTDAPSISGQYYVKAYSSATSNLVAAESNCASLKIKGILVTAIATVADREYNGGTGATCTVTLDGVKPGDNIIATVGNASFETPTAGQDKVVYCRNITLSGVNSSNYSLESSTVQTTATILPKNVTVTAGSTSRPYNGGTLTNSNCTISGQIIGDVVSCTMTSESAITNAGTVENVIDVVTISRNGNDVSSNYNPIIVNGLLTVTRIDDEIDITSVYGEYDGTEKHAEFTSLSGLTVIPTYYSDSDCTTTTDTTNSSSVGGAPSKRGVYYATAITEGNTNYRPASLECSFAVTLGVKNDTITFDDVTATYTGSALPVSGATAESGTEITYRYYRTTDCTGNAIATPINAGFYSVKATSAGNDNYRSGTKCVIYTINKGIPAVTLLSKEALYTGSPIVANTATATKPNGTNARLSYTYKYYTNDICTENETTIAPTNAGQYYAMATSIEESNMLSASSECVSHKINSLECGEGYTNNAAGGCDVITYNITYTLDEDTTNSPLNPSTFTVESNSIVLAEPVKLGYKFAGWTGSNGETPEVNVTIPQGSTGDRAYTANFYPKAEISCLNPDYNGEAQEIAVCTGGTLSANGTQTNVGDQEVSCIGDSEHSNSVSIVCSVQKVDATLTCNQDVSGTRASELITSLVGEADDTSIETITLAAPTDGSACSFTLAYDGTSDNNLRYVGANPCNYVNLEGQTYRIIGVMNNVIDGKRNSTSRLKLVATSPLPPSGLYSYDVSDEYVYDGKGANEWSRSDIMTALNEAYYTGGVATLYRLNDEPIEVNLSEFNLNSTTLVSSAVWHTAEINADFIPEESYIYELYQKERSSTVVTMPQDGHLRRTEWLGKVGAIYASDVQFATKGGEDVTRAQCLDSQANDWSLSPKVQCFENNWFSEYPNSWIINPYNDGYKCLYVNNYGGVASQDCNNMANPYPVVYLDYDALIISGEGTEKHPYELHIKPKYNGSQQTIATCENGTLSGDANQSQVGSYTLTCVGDQNHNDVTKTCSIEQAVCDSGYVNADNGGCTPIVYTITYETGDATNSPLNPTTYTVETPEIEVINPVKEGYRFAGWTGSNGEEPENPLRIAHGSFGNKTYQANWYPQAEIECLNPSYTGEPQAIAVCEDGSVSASATQSEVGEYTVACEGDDRHSNAVQTVCSLTKADPIITCSDEESLPSGVQTITDLVEDQTPDNNGIITLAAPTDGSTCTYTFAYDGTTDNNLRYVGSNPCNYIKVAGQDYRIIGVMNNIKDSSGAEKARLKLVSKEPIGDYVFDSMLEDPDNEDITGYNNWLKSDINKELNNLYYRSLSGRCYIGPNNAYKNCDFSTTGLKGSNLVGAVVWDLGGTPINESSFAGRASTYYVSERGSDTSDDRPIKWTGRVGLFYPSDYAFATSGGSETSRNTCLSVKTDYENWGQVYPDCGNNSWIIKNNYQFQDAFTMTPSLNDFYEFEAHSKYIKSDVDDTEVNNVTKTRSIYPTIYLNANASIISGSGTENDPYTLTMHSEYSGDVQIIAKCSGGTLSNEKQTNTGEYEVLCTGDENHNNVTKTCRITPQNCDDGYILDENGKCEIQNYTITYELDGGTILNEKNTYTKFEDSFYLPFPEKEGMIFVGWTGSNGENPQKQVKIESGSTGDREYVANYTEVSDEAYVYVRYDLNGGEGGTPPMKTYLYNSTINLYGGSLGSSTGTGTGSSAIAHSHNVSDEGVASGSYSNSIDDTKVIDLGKSQDVVIDVWYNTESCCDWVAVYAGSDSTPSYSNDSNVSASTGNISGKLGGYASNASSNYKTWLHTSFAINTDVIKFHFRTDSSVVSYGYYATVSSSTSKFERNGYGFVGWNTKPDGTGTHYEPGQQITITNNLDLYAEWTSYKITYNLGGGTIRSSAPTTYNPTTGITIGEEYYPVKEGYVFAGWVGSNGITRQMTVTIPGGSTGNKEFTAVWAEEFNITYNLDGATSNNNPDTYTNYTSDIYLNAPYKENNVFAGWTGSNGNTPQTSVYIPQGSRGDKEYTAHWEREYVIAYDLNGGYISSGSNPTRYSYLSDTITLRPATKSGYTFIGWTGANGETPQMTVEIPHNSRGERLYIANFEPTSYTITYDLDGGTDYGANLTSFTSSTETFSLVAPAKEGYSFIGWTGSNGNTPQTNITISQGSSGNRTYKANYENLNPITVTFDLNGGEGNIPTQLTTAYSDQLFVVKSSETVVVHTPNVTDDGYASGVYSNSVDTTTPINFDSVKEIVIDVWYDTESGCDWLAIYKGQNASVSQSNDNSVSTSTGNFTGKLQGRNSSITSSYTSWLHKTYTVETDTLKFHWRTDGSVQYNGYYAKVSYNSTPTKEGYTFLGWNTEPDGSGLHYDEGAIIIPTEDMTLYAEWGYTITLQLDGGTIGYVPEGYSVHSDTITIPRPTKVGYDFVGWTGSNGDTPELDVTIPAGSEGNKIFMAHFFNACNGELYCDLSVRASTDSSLRKYTGLVTDEVGNTVEASNVYYFAGPFSSGTTINNNVIFADTCWSIIRTTDTQGVKLLYNGEPDANNQCGTSRPNHAAINKGSRYSNYTYSYTYYYGTDYVLDGSYFRLAGDVNSYYWSSANANNVVGKYTCFSTSATGTCSTLYYIDEYSTYYAYYYYVNRVNYNFAFSTYFSNTSLLNGISYMYNNTYGGTSSRSSSNYMVNSTSYNNSYYFADDFEIVNGYYRLKGNVDTASNIGDVTGKYTLLYSNKNSTNSYLYKVISKYGSNNMYYVQYYGGVRPDADSQKIYFGTSVDCNGNTCTLSGNVFSIYKDEWVSKYETIPVGSYTCGNNSTSCSSPYQISSRYNQYYYYSAVINHKFADSFSYDSSTNAYTLTGDVINMTDLYHDYNDLKTHRYTCFTTSGTCNGTIYYVYYASNGSVSYFPLSRGRTFSEALYELGIYKDDFDVEAYEQKYGKYNFNTTSSRVKTEIDNYYRENLLEYTNMLEDNVYCNKKEVTTYGLYDEDNVEFNTNTTYFVDYNTNTDLSCKRLNDQYSTSNNDAKLTYPIGMITFPEYTLATMNNNSYSSYAYAYTGSYYWTMSPAYYSGSPYLRANSSTYYYGNSVYVRPVITLKSDVKFTSGDGSYTTPYIIDMNYE